MRSVRQLAFLLIGLVAAACSQNTGEDPNQDAENASALRAGKADGTTFTWCELDHSLAFVNAATTTKSSLTSIGVSARTAQEIISYRDAGGVALSNLFDDEVELDNVRYVGPITMRTIVNHIEAECQNLPPGQPPAPVVRRVAARADMISGTPAPFNYRIHLIDVGTGLAVLVQGTDFNLLFDAGSGDDNGSVGASNSTNRVLAYLFAALGPSGPAACKPSGDTMEYDGSGLIRIDHVVMSHPHLDHGSMMDDVLRCYDVRHVWESGAINDATFYRDFLQQMAAEPQVTYHTASVPPASRSVHVSGADISFPTSMPWVQFSDRTHVPLGMGASFTVAAVDAERHPDANDNSVVLRLDLGMTSLLLVGDAESGARLPPSSPVDGVEQILIERHPRILDVDILQVGHHGSLTSNRMEFLQAVSPEIALIGVGPKSYRGVVLPDAEVIAALNSLGSIIYRTDINDGAGCPETDRIGTDDTRPGGCDNFIVEIAPPPANTAHSCVDRCGDASTGECACDTDCVLRHDCCQDVCTSCNGLPVCERFGFHPPTAAQLAQPEVCGTFDETQSCSYAEDCASFNDCCEDICANCSTLAICGGGSGHDDDPFN